MALDHALAETLGPGQAVLRLYEWAEPTVSLGRNEPALARWGPGRPAEDPVPVAAFVRRPTGGRAVLHRGELTYAALLPDRAFGGPRAAYAALSEALVAGLGLLGIDVALAEGGAVLRPDAGPCFDAPAPGEVVAGGGKLVGSAQARLGGALLQHGAILIEEDQAVLGSSSAARPLRSLLKTATVSDVREAVVEGFRRRFADATWCPGEHHETVMAAADRWEAERYRDHAWTWRR